MLKYLRSDMPLLNLKSTVVLCETVREENLNELPNDIIPVMIRKLLEPALGKSNRRWVGREFYFPPYKLHFRMHNFSVLELLNAINNAAEFDSCKLLIQSNGREWAVEGEKWV
jgi:hypothetical protein